MSREEYVNEVRPVLRTLLSFVLYLRFGDSIEFNKNMVHYADMFLDEFEKNFKFTAKDRL
jgi:hypothetical protein